MTTVAEAIEVMSVVAACHHRTAPRMDDEEAMLATAHVWAEMFTYHDLKADDLKKAVIRRAANGAADAPEPAEIITAARAIRKERAERESTAERQAREDAWDAELLERNKQRLAELINPIAVSKTITAIERKFA